MTVPEILRAAADVVRERWAQHTIGWPGGPVCALGAAQEVAGWSFTTYSTAGQAIACALDLPGRHGSFSGAVALWNDAPDQTAENVALGLEMAALVYEQQHAQPQPDPAEAVTV